MTKSDFSKKKDELKQTYKRLKAGMIRLEDLDSETIDLLRRYYGI